MSHINANILSISAFSGVSNQANVLANSLTRIASGKRINSAADDAAGLSVATNLGTRADSLSQSMRNINDGVGLVQTAGAGLGQISQNLTRMRELAVQASNGALSNTNRAAIQTEFSTLASEIDRVAQGATFNSQPLLDGTVPAVTIQVGEDAAPSSQLSVGLVDATTGAIGLAGAAVDTQANALSAIDQIDAAIDNISQSRSQLGASENALESAFRMADSRYQSLKSAESSILDADIAQEAAEVAKNELQLKASVAVQAQANKLLTVKASLL